MQSPVSRRRFMQISTSAAAATAAGGIIAEGTASAATSAAVPLHERAVRTPARTGPVFRAAPIAPAAFQSPPQQFLPAVRWWWRAPLGIEETIREIAAIRAAGFGEVEIAYSTDAWANEVQRANLRAVLDKARQLDVTVSMTMGAAWPVQTPNTGSGTGYAQQELQYGRVDVRGGAEFSGDVPKTFDDPTGARPSILVAVTAARVITRGPAAELLPAAERPRWGTPVRIPATSTILDEASLVDLTADVANDRLIWTPPGSGDWIIFAFWQRDAAKVVTSAFDKNAAAKAAEYLEEFQIGPENYDALKKVGGDFFEDSLELNADSLFWAPSFPAEFQTRRGYPMAKYLPLMFQHGMSRYWVPTTPPVPDFDLPGGKGEKVRTDYYTLLTDLYVEHHLAPFQEWAARYGMRYKAQAAYGQDLEPIRSNRELARLGGKVEGESYNSGDRFPVTIDNYGWRFALDWQRTVVGGAHQGGTTRISTEIGAQPQNSHQLDLGDYKAMIDKEWAAGITQPFLHGFQYMSLGARWPGQYRFGDTSHDSFNDVNNPQWPVFKETNAYWARGTQVLETGTPLTDIAIYRKGFLTTAARTATDEGTQPSQLFETRRLERRGYTIQYLDPEGLAEDGVIGDGVLFPNGPRYQALVVDERAVPVYAAKALAAAAKAGLTIIFVGAVPDADAGYAAGTAGDEEVRTFIKQALKGKHVRRVETQGDVADALDQEDLAPRVAWENANVLTQLREADGVRYVFFYNPDDREVSFSPGIEGTGAVLNMNLWDGTVTPAAHYEQRKGRVVVPLTLPRQGTHVLAVDSRRKPGIHVIGDVPDTGELVTTANGTILYKTTSDGTHQFRLSKGPKVLVKTDVPERAANPGPYTWSLSVEAFTPTGHTTITIPSLSGTFPLWDWRDRPQIAGESGVGTYTSTLTIPANWIGAGKGVQINLGKVDGTTELHVNGKRVGAQIVSDVTWDLTPYIKAGPNEVKVVVRTTMRNAVTKYNQTSSRTDPYGLRGPVRVEPYAIATIYQP
ncbi:hypothetical protein Vqi01_41280 [Micromonospora qiuiae]|uniref:Glycosyl hydrolases family 2 sugar binding domain-containing protein n=1 Tax=Micromonospora qiuiae TaxID=502268 RepID=A0ABQ4JF98_9ACTN|nr:glycosyl hydrolase [Micromonospora qiuiae]GIJ28966.1 hypothetical protein Vqi01_41280 [Micromonospora qiuiae]